jgi:hypothetical protein
MNASKEYAQSLIDSACENISFLGEKAAILVALAQYIRTRVS